MSSLTVKTTQQLTLNSGKNAMKSKFDTLNVTLAYVCVTFYSSLKCLLVFFFVTFILHCHINPYKRCWNNYYSLLTTNTRLLSLHSWFWSASVFVRYTLHCTGKKDLLVFLYFRMSKRKIAKYEMTHLLSHLFFSKLL